MSAQERTKDAARGDAGEDRTQSPAADLLPLEPNLDKIREILLGEPLRRVERRVGQMEERLQESLASLKGEIDKRLAALEDKVKIEIEAVWKRLDMERRERTEAVRELDEGLRDQILAERRDRNEMVEKMSIKIDEALESTGSRVASLEKRAAREESKLEQAVQAIEKCQESIRDLRVGKMDRSAFAALLTEMTAGLTEAGGKPSE